MKRTKWFKTKKQYTLYLKNAQGGQKMGLLLFFRICGTLSLLIINLRDSTVVRLIGNSWNFADKKHYVGQKGQR